MAEKRIVKVTEAERDNLERLHYEVNADAEIIRAYLDDHRLDPDATALDGTAFKAYKAEHAEKYREYQKAKDALADKYGFKDENWSLDFAECEVTVG